MACASSQLLVSARLQPLHSVDKLRSSVKHGERFHSSIELLVHLLRDQGDVLTQIVRETTASVDRIEDQLLSQRLSDNRAELGSMRRVLVRLQRLLALEPGRCCACSTGRPTGCRNRTYASCARPQKSSPW